MVENTGVGKEEQPSKREERLAKRQGVIYGGPLVCSKTYNDFTKEQRRDAHAHLKAFLKGKLYYRCGYEVITREDLEFKVPRIRQVRRFTTAQYEQMQADATRRTEEEE